MQFKCLLIHTAPTGKLVWWSTCFYFANKICLSVLNRYTWKAYLCKKKIALWERTLYLSPKSAFSFYLLALTWQDMVLGSLVVKEREIHTCGICSEWGVRINCPALSIEWLLLLKCTVNWKLRISNWGIWFQSHKALNLVFSSTSHFLGGVGKMCVAGTVSRPIPCLDN